MRKYFRAGFTVETALLIPFLLSVILIVVYVNIYLYNRVIMQAAVCRGAQKVFFYEGKDNDEIEGKCANVVLSEINDMLVWMKNVEVEVKVSSAEVTVSVQGELNVPSVIFLEPLISDDFWKMEAEWTEYRLNAPDFVKSTYHAFQLWDYVSGGNTEEKGSISENTGILQLPNGVFEELGGQ